MSLVEVYEAADNEHDLDAVMAMYAADAVFEIVGQGTLVGKDRIRAIHDYGAGIDTEVRFSNCVAEGDTVTCEAIERNDWQRAANVEEYRFTSVVFTFKDGLIERISYTMSPESAQAMGRALQEFHVWATENRPDESAKLFTAEGQFIYSHESGVRVVGLLEEWQASIAP